MGRLSAVPTTISMPRTGGVCPKSFNLMDKNSIQSHLFNCRRFSNQIEHDEIFSHKTIVNRKERKENVKQTHPLLHFERLPGDPLLIFLIFLQHPTSNKIQQNSSKLHKINPRRRKFFKFPFNMKNFRRSIQIEI